MASEGAYGGLNDPPGVPVEISVPGLEPATLADEAVLSARTNSKQRRGRSRAYAALDLGTNNCRLLVALPTSSGFRVIDAFSRIVRLGEGLSASSRLSEAAIARSIDALRICRDKMEARGVRRARLIATEACRAAKNGPDFIARVRAETGLDLEIVDRETEAFLAVSGCAVLADPRAEAVVLFDIGGGSTEIAWLDGPDIPAAADPWKRVRAWVSVPAGVVTLAEKYGGEQVDRACFEAMVADMLEKLEGFRAAVGTSRIPRHFHLLGTSGTVTTMAGLHLHLPRYDRRRVDGLWMSDQDAGRVIDRLIGMDYAARAANACIGHDRADLVLAGCAIYEALRRAFPSRSVRIADRGLREGILLNMMREDGFVRRPCEA